MSWTDSTQGRTQDQFSRQRIAVEREKRRRAQRDSQGLTSALQAEAAEPVQPLRFRGANLEIQSYRGHEWLVSGPAETGKTFAVVWLLDQLMRETPGAQGVLARKLQVSLWGTVLVTYRKLQERRVALGEKPAAAYGGEKPEWFQYANGSRLWVGGLDNPNKMLSAERDFIYINQAEETQLNDWETLLTRCTGRGAVTQTPMLFGDCNPGPEDHWILSRPSIRLFHSKHQDNPALFDDAGGITEQGERSLAALRTLTGSRRARLLEGRWVGAEGQFFEEWDEDLHVVEPFEVPRDWPVWGALDYGFAHPTAFGIFTESNDGEIYMIAEHVQNKWLVPQHCRAIQRLIDKTGMHGRVKQIVSGHDCFQQRGDSNAKTIAQQYKEARDPENSAPIGLTLSRATVDRVAGAAEILTRLGNREAGLTPKLYFFNTCRRTIATMPRMVIDPNDDEDAKKVDADVNGLGGDDCYDCARYGVMARRRVFKSGKTVGHY